MLTVGALLAIAGSIALSWKYASNGHVFPGLGVLGLGGAASVGIYTTGKAIVRRTQSQIRSTVITPEEITSQKDEQERYSEPHVIEKKKRPRAASKASW